MQSVSVGHVWLAKFEDNSGHGALRYPTTGIWGCCARPGSDHAAAAPLSPATNLRLWMRIAM
jgi:hypothetical protein